MRIIRPARRRTGALVIGVLLAAGSPALLPSPADAARVPDVTDAGVETLSRWLASGKVTSAQLVRAYEKRIAAYEGPYGSQPGVNAVISLNGAALREAVRLDAERRRGRVRGPLHGVPILVKDNYDTADMPTTNASLALAGTRTPDDATQVKRLRDAGAIILGKTNLHEYAFGVTTISSLGGQTRNPYDQSRNPGGSSGGTGAGVAAGFAPIGMGTDTCGSIRIPSSHNSLVGLRPTLGLSSRDGIMPMSQTQDTGGPLGRSVRDVALVLDATVGYDPKDPVTKAALGRTPRSYVSGLDDRALRGRRIGVMSGLFLAKGDQKQTSDLVRAAAQDMRRQGATVVDLGAQTGLLTAMDDASVVLGEFERDLNAYLASPGMRFPKGLAAKEAPYDKVTLADIVTSGKVTPSVLAILKTLVGTTPKAGTPQAKSYATMLANRAKFQKMLGDLYAAYRLDAVVYPTITQQAQPLEDPDANANRNCAMSANSGYPALSVPAGFTAQGMPVGVELLGRPFSEPTLLAMGYDYEQATGKRRAPSSTPPLKG
ncbi:amidase family protein [Actinomadura fibrosa]|uniref:Amidase family protein n=1 Tax=Actinomadura fibrosa TaxID=111802 RepID=A0ABW2XZC6_9ACTN|nr:amidase family protein [Actinomadura fibrosa]